MRLVFLGIFLLGPVYFSQDLDLSATTHVESLTGNEVFWSLRVHWRGSAGDVVVKPLNLETSHPLANSLALSSASFYSEGLHGVFFRFRLKREELQAEKGPLPPVVLSYLNMLNAGKEAEIEVSCFEWNPGGKKWYEGKFWGFGLAAVLMLGLVGWAFRAWRIHIPGSKVDGTSFSDGLVQAFYTRSWGDFFSCMHKITPFPFKDMSSDEIETIRSSFLYARREPDRREIERLTKEIRRIEKMGPEIIEDEDLILDSVLEEKL